MSRRTAVKVVAAIAVAGYIKKQLDQYANENHTLPSQAHAQSEVKEAQEAGLTAHWALKEQKCFKNAEGLLIHTDKHTPPDVKGTVFLLHGFGEHSGRYKHVIKALNEMGMEVYTLDHQGHGRSQGDRAYVRDFECFVDDVMQYINAVDAVRPDAKDSGKKLKRFLIGHSMGGLIATGVASRAPHLFDGVILSSAWLRLDNKTEGDRPIIEPLIRLVNYFFPKMVITKGLPSEYVSSDPAIVSHYMNDPLNCASTGLRARLFTTVLNAQDSFRKNEYKSMAMPLLVYHGTADKLTNPLGSQQIYDLCPSKDKTLKFLDGGSHELFNEPNKDNKGRNPAIGLVCEWIAERL